MVEGNGYSLEGLLAKVDGVADGLAARQRRSPATLPTSTPRARQPLRRRGTRRGREGDVPRPQEVGQPRCRRRHRRGAGPWRTGRARPAPHPEARAGRDAALSDRTLSAPPDPMLMRMSELFSTLTIGRYAALRIDADGAASSTLGLRDDERTVVEVGAMSEGTTEQLFLALSCFEIGIRTFIEATRNRHLTEVAAIGAGTNCG